MTDPRQRESRLGAEAASSENQPGGDPFSSVLEPTHAGTDDTTDDLWRRFYNLPTTEYLEGLEDGLIHGDVIGYQRAHDEWHARAEVSAAIAQQVARMGPADELEARRGRPERAARLRQIMADRGVTG